ncbi:unnamed protein product [Moneuplotes crassus]|uniref:Cyclic nucleotide-binding domain-containing protein n=1 Tax=Euplotes crassus TaxID=5936 RepID=A0AAD1Y328_EUPCR|nr:unnamed protein product [Moneuplotes crassus]
MEIILKKPASERSEQNIRDLREYFKENKFFKEQEKENGEAWSEMILKAIKYQKINKGKYVMRFGDFGTTYYIIVKGKVEIRVPNVVNMEFTFKELMIYIHKNHEFIIKNEKSNKLLEIIYVYFPECFKKSKKYAFIPSVAENILYGDFDKKALQKHNGVFPSFKEKDDEGKWVEISKPFTFNFLNPITTASNGAAFGELALLNDKPRSATIITLEDTHFAILEKVDFKRVMEKSLKNKFAAKVNFLNNFPFIQNLTKIAKEKLSLLMKRVECKSGQRLTTEGEDLKYIYLIEEGEFEVQKTVYFNKKVDIVDGFFLRVFSTTKLHALKKLLGRNRIAYTEELRDKYKFVSESKVMKKKTFRLSIIGKEECAGIMEIKFNCPFAFTTVECHSRVGSVQKIDRSEFLKRIKLNSSPMIKTVKTKFNFYVQRLLALFRTHHISIPQSYEMIASEAGEDIDESDKSSDNGKEEKKASIPDENNKEQDEEDIDSDEEVKPSKAKKKLNRAVDKIFVKKKLGQLKMNKKNKKFSLVAGYTLDQNDYKPFKSSTKSVLEEVTIGDEDIRRMTIIRRSSRNINLRKTSSIQGRNAEEEDKESIPEIMRNNCLSPQAPQRFRSPQPGNPSMCRVKVIKVPSRKETIGSVSSLNSEDADRRVCKSTVKKRPYKTSGFVKAKSNNLLKPTVLPLASQRNQRKDLKFQNLDKCLEGIESKMVFSPQINTWKSSKVTRMKPLKKPYRLKTQAESKKPNSILNVINFDPGKERVSRNPGLPLKSKTSFPRINQLRKFRPRLQSTVDESQDHLDTSSLQDIADSIPNDIQIPFFKSQYSIGQKCIPYKKQGKMTFLRESYHKTSRY